MKQLSLKATIISEVVLIVAVIILTGFLTYHAPDWLIFEDMG